MTRILQLTDTHVVAAPGLVSGRVDTRAHLKRAVARVLELLPQIGPIDLLLITGDLTDYGQPEDYATFRALMAPLAHLPLAVIPGNHDLREPMRAAFVDLPEMPADGSLNWVRKVGGVRVIGLDSLVEGQAGGALGPDTLAYLDKALADGGPMLVAVHHPPILSGTGFMDAIGLADADAMAGVLAQHGGPVRVACGHVHRTIVGLAGGAVTVIGPSTAHSIGPDLRADAPVGFFEETGGMLLHEWAEGGWRSTAISLESPRGPFPF